MNTPCCCGEDDCGRDGDWLEEWSRDKIALMIRSMLSLQRIRYRSGQTFYNYVPVGVLAWVETMLSREVYW